MDVTSVKYGTVSGTYDAVIGGRQMFVPDDMGNRQRRAIQTWLDVPNTPENADPAPVAPTLSGAIAGTRATDQIMEDIFARLEALESA